MVIRDSPTGAWRVMGSTESESDDVNIHTQGSETESGTTTGQKRARSPSITDGPQTKRPRDSGVDSSHTQPCLAPPLNPIAQKILSEAGESGVSSLGSGDIFLTEGWRELWCRCPSVRTYSTLLAGSGAHHIRRTVLPLPTSPSLSLGGGGDVRTSGRPRFW